MTRLPTTLCALLALVLPSIVRADDGHWADVESQIQYGFYAEEERALENLAATLSQSASGEGRSAYYAALANYRLAQTLRARDRDREHDRARATVAATRCASELDTEALRNDPEALALGAACVTLARALKALRLPQLAGDRAAGSLARAVKLAPRNPRVVLLDGLDSYERASDAADRDQALQRLQQAVALFEAERQGASVTPGWGAAEAYAVLARALLDRGDAAAARSALERALLIAPDFALARRLLARIVG